MCAGAKEVSNRTQDTKISIVMQRGEAFGGMHKQCYKGKNSETTHRPLPQSFIAMQKHHT